MSGKVILLLPAFLLPAFFSSGNPGNSKVLLAETYRKADKFFNSSSPTASTDSTALACFEQVIDLLEKAPDNNYDSLLFQSYLKKGILLDVVNKNTAAKDAYLKAAAIPARNNTLSDSLLFRPYIYVGSGYFNLNNFDSANYFLIKAEALIKLFPHLPETERLYNTLGALNYINGNYLQSRNYFNQALELIKSRQPFDRVFALGLETNIATSFYKLGRYPEALAMYNNIIKEKISAAYIYNGICMNMGKAYAAIKKYPEALACFKKINPQETPGVLNELGLCYYEMKQPGTASQYLNQLQALHRNNKVNILDIGLNDLYRADLLNDKEQYADALVKLQNSICIFSSNFNNRDIYTNPTIFTGSYTYFRLFDALYKKAQTFESLNRSASNEKYLIASLAAYKTALTLLGFIEKSYDTDDAKLFLKKKSQDIYEDALLVCLQLYQLHPGAGYLDQAFMITEKNKASVIAANLRQRDFTSVPGIDQSFLQTERNIKFNIARLDVKSEQAKDNAEIEGLAKEKAKYEIELSQLQKNLEQNSRYFQMKYDDANYSVPALRQHIGNNQALFSFYSTKKSLHVFAFTKSSFSYTRIDSTAGLQQETEQWTELLKNSGDGRKFKGDVLGQLLYNHLIKPMQLLVPGKNEWIIIPDGNLYFLPFESLPDGTTGKTMLETTTISYQFSSRFMMGPSVTDKKENPLGNVLSFAPFATKGAEYQQTGLNSMNQLPASADEIASLDGARFTDSHATKSRFLQEVNKYPIIHLATHAFADVQNPEASFIAFYPEKKLPAEDCLYLEEIYGLNLDACKLVIISACETGKGELVNNEGLISLGRAFAYAGCGATINSLWKADDKATAAILKRFHFYLQDGYTKSKALQKAKLDYINSDVLYKSPAYWANLIITGNDEPVYRKAFSFIPVIIIAVPVCLFVAGMVMIKRRKKSRRFSQLPNLNSIIAKS